MTRRLFISSILALLAVPKAALAALGRKRKRFETINDLLAEAEYCTCERGPMSWSLCPIHGSNTYGGIERNEFWSRRYSMKKALESGRPLIHPDNIIE